MPKTKALLADKGATAENWFIHTPICEQTPKRLPPPLPLLHRAVNPRLSF